MFRYSRLHPLWKFISNACSCLSLSLILFSCASTRMVGDPWRDSSKTEISKSDFTKLNFKAFGNGPVCEGTRVLKNLTYTVTIVPPVYKNISTTEAAMRSQEFVAAVKDYLEGDFLYNASNPTMQDQNFENCSDYRVYTGTSGFQGECWIQASNKSAPVLNKNVASLKHILLAHSSDLAVYRKNFIFSSPSDSFFYVVEGRDRVWKEFLSSAKLEEADQEDGSVKYTLFLHMDRFCLLAAQVSDFVSK